MALKALMLRKKIDTKTKELEALRALDDEFVKREEEIALALIANSYRETAFRTSSWK